jgi:hypothetical protein
MLNRQRAQPRADGLQHCFTRLAIGVGNAHFDQLVALQADIELAQHSIGETLVADQNYRMQAVRAGFEGLALRRSQLLDRGGGFDRRAGLGCRSLGGCRCRRSLRLRLDHTEL